MTRLILLCGFVLFCMMPGAISAQTENADRGYIQAFLEDNLSDAGRDVRIIGFAGALSSRATIEQLTIADDTGVWLTLKGVALSWNRSAILRGSLEIAELSATEFTMARVPVVNAPEDATTGFKLPDLPQPEAKPFSLPDLPVAISIAKIEIGKASFGKSVFGQAASVKLQGSANLDDGSGAANLDITRVDGMTGAFKFDGSYSNASRILAVSLELSEATNGIAANLIGLPGRPSVDLSIKGDGPISAFTAKIDLDTDGEDRITGEVSLQSGGDDGASADQMFAATIGGDIRPLVLPQYRDFFGANASLDLRGARPAAGGLRLDELSLASDALSLNGLIELGTDSWPLRINVDGRIASADKTPVLLSLPGVETRVQQATFAASYDVAESEDWDISLIVDELQQTGVSITKAAIKGTGQLAQGNGALIGQIGGAFDIDVKGFAPDDASLATAVGADLTGRLRFAMPEAEPLTISNIALSGSDYSLDGDLVVQGLLNDMALAVSGQIDLNANDLSRFAGVSVQNLSGAANLNIAGSIEVLDGGFDVKMSGETENLSLGIAKLDPLIAGTGTLDLAARRDTTGIVIESVNIATQHSDISASATLTSNESLAQFEAKINDVSLIDPKLLGVAEMSGNLRQTGPDWAVDIDATGPGNVIATLKGNIGIIDGLLDQISGKATIQAESLSPYSGLIGQEVDGGVDVTMTGNARPKSDVADSQFDISLIGSTRDITLGIAQLDALLAGAGSLTAKVNGANATTTLESLSITTRAVNLTANAAVISDQISGRFDARLADISLVEPKLTGPATLSGSVDQMGAVWALDLDGSGPGQAVLSFDGTVEPTQNSATNVAGTLNIDADDVAPYSDLVGRQVSGGINLAVIGTAAIAAELGDSQVDIGISGTSESLTAGIAQLDALLAGSGTIAATIQHDETGTLIDDLSLNTPTASLSATAKLTPAASDARFSADLLDIGVLEPKLIGPASLSGTARQTGKLWSVNLDATAPGTATASLVGTVDLQAGSIGNVTGRANATIADLSPYSALAGRGISGGFDVSASGTGDVSQKTFMGNLNANALNLTSGMRDVDILLRGNSTLDIVARQEANGIAVFDKFELITPQILADMTGSISPNKSRLRFNVDLRNIALYTPDFSGPVAASGVAAMSGSNWTLDTNLTGPGGISAAVAGQITKDARAANLTIAGAGPLGLINTYIAPNLATGTFGFDLALNGPLAVNSLSGTVRTANAALSVPSQRVALADLTVAAQLGAGRMQVDAAANVSSGGRISVSGPISLAAPFRSDITAVLSDIGVTEPGIYETTVAGNIAVSGPLAGGAAITGALNLGPVEIRVPEASGSAALALPGLKHVNEPSGVRQTRIRAGLVDTGASSGAKNAYPLDIVINAPGRIFIRGRGLDAELGGNLRLRGTTAQVVPDGRFDLIRGRLDILGQRLDLTTALAQLQGNFDPYLRIVAETESDGTTIRIVIEGLVSEITVAFESSPQLPEDEVLARLLFGREISQISALQALQIAAAIRTLAGGGGEGLVNRLRENFGLDDLDVTTSETGETGVRVGKYITENIYSDVTVNSSGQSEINLNLTITPSITARGTVRSDGNTGLGVFIEKDY